MNYIKFQKFNCNVQNLTYKYIKMLQAKEIFQLLNKKEKRNFCILIMLMILNSAFEILK